jgi:putative transposase
MASHQRKARRQRATLIFADESGFSLIPTRIRTWAPIGHTPIVKHCYRWPKFSAISGVGSNGKLYMLVRTGTIATQQVLVFLRHLLRHIRGRVIVVWDNINFHRAVSVKRFVLDHRRRLAVEYLPPYSPELNPDERVWRYLKHVELANFAPRDLRELKVALRGAVQRIRMRPKLMQSFLDASALSS